MAVWNEPRSFWTWGNVSDEPSEEERHKMAKVVSQKLGQAVTPPPVPKLDDVQLSPSRIEVPADVSEFVMQDTVNGPCIPMADIRLSCSRRCADNSTIHRMRSPSPAPKRSWKGS